MPKKHAEIVVKPRHHSRRAASKEALKQMQILLDDEDDDAVEIRDDDSSNTINSKRKLQVIPVSVSPPKKKYKLTHRKSADDRDVIVLKSITPSITNHYVENNLELECWTEDLEPCQKARIKQIQDEEKEMKKRIDELLKSSHAEVIFKGDLSTAVEVKEHVQKAIASAQASSQPNIILNNAVANPGNQSYQLVMDPRLGLIVGAMPPSAAQPAGKQIGKVQVAQNLQTPPTPNPPGRRGRKRGGAAAAPVAPPPPPPPAPAPRTTAASKRVISTPTLPPPPATRRTATPAAYSNVRPTETNVEGGLSTGNTAAAKPNKDDGKPLPDSREISFNKLQGKTFPSLVVVARPHLRVMDVNADRPKLDAKVKSVLMHAPTKFTEWLIQQGLVRSEQRCSIHSTTQLKLGMYSDVSKFPYSGGYVWISECCPSRFVSVFSGSLFEGSPHPPLVILKLLYHWACQTNIQNVTQWVKVDNLYVKGMYTWLRSICTVALQTHIRQLGGPNSKVEVGVISLGTTSQDGNSRQVKVEVLGILETASKLIRLRAVEPLADGDRNYKKRFSKILEPLVQWVHPSSTIVTDLTVDKATLHQMGFLHVVQSTSSDASNSNRTVMEYLRRIVPRMFQNTLSLLSRQIIQQFLDELVWREWFGTTSLQAFDNLVVHLSEQTRFEANQSLIVRLNRVALNPFKNWAIPSNNVAPKAAAPKTATPKAAAPKAVAPKAAAPKAAAPKAAAPKAAAAKVVETNVVANTTSNTAFSNVAKKRNKRKEPEPQKSAPPPPPPQVEVSRPPKSTSPDVPEQMVPLENYYYGNIDNYPPKTNIILNMKCPFCKEMFNNNIVLMNHLFKHAHNVSKDGQMCRYCLTSVPTANDLLKHIATSHPAETKFDNGFVCLICETQYMNPFVLGKHMSKEHCPSELPYQCGTCGYRCSNHKQAIDHFYKQHDNGPTIQCPFCLKSTTVFSSSRNIVQNMNYFIQHLQKHQRKQFARRCGKCNLWFVQKDVLKDHQIKMHVSQRGKRGLVPWTAPRNGVMVPKSKMDKFPCDAEGINFSALYFRVTKSLTCKECEMPLDTPKHFPSFESCQIPNCQYSTCCTNAMQEHNARCSKNPNPTIAEEKLPYEMFCVCGFSSIDGNQMAKHLAICERKSAYSSLSDSKSACVTHSMLDVLGLVRKPGETDKKIIRTKPDPDSIEIDDDDDEPLVNLQKAVPLRVKTARSRPRPKSARLAEEAIREKERIEQMAVVESASFNEDTIKSIETPTRCEDKDGGDGTAKSTESLEDQRKGPSLASLDLDIVKAEETEKPKSEADQTDKLQLEATDDNKALESPVEAEDRREAANSVEGDKIETSKSLESDETEAKSFADVEDQTETPNSDEAEVSNDEIMEPKAVESKVQDDENETPKSVEAESRIDEETAQSVNAKDQIVTEDRINEDVSEPDDQTDISKPAEASDQLASPKSIEAEVQLDDPKSVEAEPADANVQLESPKSIQIEVQLDDPKSVEADSKTAESIISNEEESQPAKCIEPEDEVPEESSAKPFDKGEIHEAPMSVEDEAEMKDIGAVETEDISGSEALHESTLRQENKDRETDEENFKSVNEKPSIQEDGFSENEEEDVQKDLTQIIEDQISALTDTETHEDTAVKNVEGRVVNNEESIEAMEAEDILLPPSSNNTEVLERYSYSDVSPMETD